MVLNLKLTNRSQPKKVLKLPEGRLVFGMSEIPFHSKEVIECAKLIIKIGGHDQRFHTQASIIAFAGNNFGWGKGGGYATL